MFQNILFIFLTGVATSLTHYNFELGYVRNWGVVLTSHLHLELRLRIVSGYNSASPLACNGETFTFTYDKSWTIKLKESHFWTFLNFFSGSHLTLIVLMWRIG